MTWTAASRPRLRVRMTRLFTFLWQCAHMGELNRRLGSAHVLWNDYVGTAAADDAGVVLDSRSLYEIADLDRDRWAIVGIDLSLGAAADPVVVYAFDRSPGLEVGEDVDEIAVQAFRLSASTRLDQFLTEAFQRVSVRLVSSMVEGKELVVADAPPTAATAEQRAI